MKTSFDEVEPYRTKDGSLIRELMHPTLHGNIAQSLAHATIDAGLSTRSHYHRHSEELYHVIAGRCRLSIGTEVVDLAVGDTVLIAPGTPHSVYNPGPEPVQLLCCCSPPYAHEDTVLVAEPAK